MKIVITSIKQIVGKDKREWTKANFVKASTGETGEIFAKKADFDAFGLTDEHAVSTNDLKSFVANSPVVDADFDEKGRLLGIQL